MSTLEEMNQILCELNGLSGVNASAIVSRDGLLMASDIPEGLHGETFAAMSATMLGAAETVIGELEKGIPERVIVESNMGKMVATGAGPKALIVVLADTGIGLGLVLVEIEKASEKLKELL